MILMPDRRIVAPRLAFKPDRSIPAPGWDDLPIDRPRARSAWWPHIIGPRMALNQKPACCCASCSPTKVCIKTCSGTVPVYGAIVQIVALSLTCTTDATGCCTLAIPSAGTYTVQVTVGGTVVSNASHALTCGGTLTLSLSLSNIVCCGGYAIPYNLTATDAAGTFPLTYDPSTSNPWIWYGCIIVSRLSSQATGIGGCGCGAPATQNMEVCYLMTCNPSASPKFGMQRSWGWVPCNAGAPIWSATPSPDSCAAGISSPPNGCGVPAGCGTPNTDTAIGNATPTSSAPFAVSFSLTDNVANQTGDPIGSGSVSVSA